MGMLFQGAALFDSMNVEENTAFYLKQHGDLITKRHYSEEEIRAFCRERLAHFKVPRYVWFVTEFPMTVTGKLQKFRMREIAAEKLARRP